MPVSHLANIQQGKSETLGSYLARFRKERTKVAVTSDKAVKILAIGGVRPHTPFWKDLQAEECKTLDRFYEMAERHLRVENAKKLTRKGSPEPSRSAHNKPTDRRDEPRTNLVGSDRPRNDRGPFPYIPKFTNFTRLTASYDQIYAATRDKRIFTEPSSMRSDKSQRDPNRYCHFHRDVGHDTAQCCTLKNVIEDLVRKGHFKEYLVRPPQQGQQHGGTEQENTHAEPLNIVRTIMGDTSIGGASGRSRRNLAREARYPLRNSMNEIEGRPPKSRSEGDLIVCFPIEEAMRVHRPHNDALVIKAQVCNSEL